MRKYKSNNNILYSCKYHVIFCPKYRRPVLVGEIADKLKVLIYEVCNKYRTEIIELEIMPDHVHLLLEVDPQFGINKVIKRIKGTSANILRKEHKELCTKLPTLWTNSYFVATVGGAPIAILKQYVEAQKRSEPRGKKYLAKKAKEQKNKLRNDKQITNL